MQNIWIGNQERLHTYSSSFYKPLYWIGSCVLSSPPFALHGDFGVHDMFLPLKNHICQSKPPMVIKVYIFWKEISWGMQICYWNLLRVQYKLFLAGNFHKKWKCFSFLFKIHIFFIPTPSIIYLPFLNSSLNFPPSNVYL